MRVLLLASLGACGFPRPDGVTAADASSDGATITRFDILPGTSPTSPLPPHVLRGDIHGDAIDLYTFGDSPPVVASFDTAGGATVTVQGTAQVSGTTQLSFQQPVSYHVAADDGSARDYLVQLHRLALSAHRLGTTHKPSALALADLDGDGRLDVLVAGKSLDGLTGAIDVYARTNGAAIFEFSSSIDIPDFVPDALALADLDHDGTRDVVLCSKSATAGAWYPNQSAPGSFKLANGHKLPSVGACTNIVGADLNADATGDLVYANGLVPQVVLSPANAETSQALQVSSVRTVAVANVDDDPRLDIIALSNNGAYVTRNQTPAGAGMFSSPMPTRVAVTNGLDLAIGTLDGNAQPDLLVRLASSLVPLHDVGGTSPTSTTPILIDSNHKLLASCLVDVDRDKIDDAIAISASGTTTNGELDVNVSTGTASFVGVTGASYQAETPFACLATDLDGDLVPELVVLSDRGPTIYTLVEMP